MMKACKPRFKHHILIHRVVVRRRPTTRKEQNNDTRTKNGFEGRSEPFDVFFTVFDSPSGCDSRWSFFIVVVVIVDDSRRSFGFFFF
jgi:hypothetical protein